MLLSQLVQSIQSSQHSPYGMRLLRSTINDMGLSPDLSVGDDTVNEIASRLIAGDRKSSNAAAEGSHDPVGEALCLLSVLRRSA